MNKLECRYTLPAKDPEVLECAVRDTLEDLVFSQIGRWAPYEVRLQLPMALINHNTTKQLTQSLGHWLSAQGYAWLMLAGAGPNTTLLVRCRAITGGRH